MPGLPVLRVLENGGLDDPRLNFFAGPCFSWSVMVVSPSKTRPPVAMFITTVSRCASKAFLRTDSEGEVEVVFEPDLARDGVADVFSCAPHHLLLEVLELWARGGLVDEDPAVVPARLN